MTTAKVSKNWLLGTRLLEFETSYALPVGGLSSLIDGCLRRLDPKLARGLHHDELTDFKGRNPQDLILPGISPPRTDELFRIGGSIAVAETKGTFAWEPFEAVCYSPFTRFEGTHHIVFNTTTEKAGALPSWLPARLLGSAAPIKPTFFRYGLEHFRSRLTFASLGYSPQVTESMLIDSVSDSLTIRMTCEVTRAASNDPFSENDPYITLCSIIKEATGHDLLADFRSHVLRAA